MATQRFFMFTPNYLRKWSQFDEHMFFIVVQMGWSWNHQPVAFFSCFWCAWPLVLVTLTIYFQFAWAREAGTSEGRYMAPLQTDVSQIFCGCCLLWELVEQMIHIFFTTFFFQMDWWSNPPPFDFMDSSALIHFSDVVLWEFRSLARSCQLNKWTWQAFFA